MRALYLLIAAAPLGQLARGNVCTRAWPDVCPPQGGGPAGCVPFAPPPPAPVDWLALRARLVNELFGVTNGTLPARGPDYVIPVGGPTSRGCWCSTLGNCDAASCTWASNQTLLIHTITVPVNASFTLTLNSTVTLTLNTSGVAPVNYAPLDAVFPDVPFPPTRRSDTLVVLHQGHDQPPCVLPDGLADFDGTIDWLNQLGYDVANHDMPTYQANAVNSYNVSCAFNAHKAAPARCARSCDPSDPNNQPYARLSTLIQQAITHFLRSLPRRARLSCASFSSPSCARSTTRLASWDISASSWRGSAAAGGRRC
jgi:hypothetical protein